MATSKAEEITEQLRQVAEERRRRNEDPDLGNRVRALKIYQQRRFEHTHVEALKSPRYRAASRFFLEHLYGPEDFTSRDDQFARVVPALVRIFPAEVISTVANLARLHAISERLDSRMGSQLDAEVQIDRASYVAAWQGTAHYDLRDKQIELSLQIGASLDRLTRNPIIRHSLRMMRGPAKAAGLSDLQTFLETGFEAFRAMRGASEFLDSISRLEHSFADTLGSAKPPFDGPEILEQLP